MSETLRCQEAVAVVLPSLDPDYKFRAVVKGLVEGGFQHIVIVDDGSDEAHRTYFEEAAAYPVCHMLRHPVNLGKGRALKDAFRYVLDELPEVQGVVTIDGNITISRTHSQNKAACCHKGKNSFHVIDEFEG